MLIYSCEVLLPSISKSWQKRPLEEPFDMMLRRVSLTGLSWMPRAQRCSSPEYFLLDVRHSTLLLHAAHEACLNTPSLTAML